MLIGEKKETLPYMAVMHSVTSVFYRLCVCVCLVGVLPSDGGKG